MIKMKYTIKLVLASMLATLTLGGCGSDSKKTPIKIEDKVEVTFDYQQLIDDAVTDIVPGIVLLVETPQDKFLGSSGLSDKETFTPMTTQVLMPNGSAGKKLTALLAAMLEYDGLLNLEDTINTWLPDTLLSQIENSDEMTLRQLLNHTSGVYDYLDDEIILNFFEAIQNDTDSLKTDSFALQFALNQPAYFLPGKGFEYSNTGYLLAGLIMDKVLGAHHSTAMRDRIFTPFSLEASHYGGVEKSLGDIISGYYTEDDGNVINTKTWYENIGVADAPLVSNVEDMAQILKVIISDESLVTPEIKEILFGESNLIYTDDGDFYGLGIFKTTLNGKTVYHHNGLEIGYSTTNIYIQETQTSITAFFNCGGSDKCEKQTDTVIAKVLNNVL